MPLGVVRSVSDLRGAVARALNVIPDLSVAPQWPDVLTPPVAVLGSLTIKYDVDMQSDQVNFAVTVYTGDQTDGGAQTRLDGHCDPAGPSSVRAAIDRDYTLGGVVQTATVVSADKYGLHDYQNQRLWGAEFLIELVVYR